MIYSLSGSWIRERMTMLHTSRPGRGRIATWLMGALFAWLASIVPAASSIFNAIPGQDPVAAIAQTFAKSSVDRGGAVGVGVGILLPGQPPRFFSYGLGNAATGQPFGPDLAFQIGSVTKVFTTNLLGQEIYRGTRHLDDALSAFPMELGSFKPLTREVTLKQLADFTGGFPSLAPICNDSPPKVPGCLKTDRPTPEVYTARDFLTFFQNTVPKNYQNTKTPPVTSLPAPYFYSDFSVGLLGLILGGNPKVPLDNQALNGWESLLQNRLLRPLLMGNTYLYPSPRSQVSVALGYDQAVGSAVITNGQVSEIVLGVPGSGYTSSPQVSISGGGGTGAEATANIDGKGAVTGFSITSAGTGYVAPPKIAFSSGGATANVIVSNGKVAGIKISDHGSGYTTAPNVTISGGRRNGIGRDATGIALISSGQVTFVSLTDAGDGYEPSVSVIVKPGQPLTNAIPIWAPAGALHSTIRDMTAFTAAALGQTRRGLLSIDPAITAGFKIAETPYACSGASPDLSGCQEGTLLSGLSWAILPEDKVNNVPAIVLKNGGLNGFSTQLFLMPVRNLGVVVFVNSNGETDTGEKTGEAELIGRNILYALYYELLQPGRRPN